MSDAGSDKEKALAVDETKLQAFGHQVAGHGGLLHTEDNRMLIKPLDRREHEFYEQAAHHPEMKMFFAEYYGVLELAGGSSEQTADGEAAREASKYICLENLVCGFEKTCIIDIKIGTRLYGDDATPEKQRRMEQKARERTSAAVGSAVCGLSVYGQPKYDRQMFSKMTVQGYKDDALVPFFAAAKDLVSEEYRRFIIDQMIAEIQDYRAVVSAAETRMYGSSLLLVYDASAAKYAKFVEDTQATDGAALFDVKAIDFAHSTWTPGQGPDEQYLFGLDSLVRLLREVRDE
ncbi:hypothetical protein GGI07_003575 [Coemansia sp. Benny D115]|nr:hypothetical protein GGI07_003575 [Coemansia sp. Benny D115]